jgi:hypothetical protein
LYEVLEGIKVQIEAKHIHSVKLQRSLYGLKQSSRMWYNRLSEFLLGKGFIKNDCCPCIFIRKSKRGFYIISIYIDDLNIIKNIEDIKETSSYLKIELEITKLDKTKYCIVLQLEHNPKGVLLHQSTYIKKILEKFNIKDLDITLMVVRSLIVENDPFRPWEDNKKL